MKEDMVFILLLAVAVQPGTVLLQGSGDLHSNTTKTFFLDEVPDTAFERTLILSNHLFVDKTMFIEELINRQKRCEVISRPSRWGKTFNMKMTASFFDIPLNEDGSIDHHKRDMIKSFFEGGSVIVLPGNKSSIETKPLEISNVKIAMEEMGRHPTISISFIGCGETFDEFIEDFAGQISRMISAKKYASFLPKYCEESVMRYTCYELLNGTREKLAGNLDTLERSVEILIGLLSSHFKSKTVVLIDEFDYALNRMICNHADFNKTAAFLRNLFTRTFDGTTSTSIYRGVVTGILQFSRLGVSSAVAACEDSGVLKTQFTPHFGFTEANIRTLLEKNPSFPHNLTELKTWYDGYTLGKYRMCNPQSICRSFQDNQMDNYWINSVPLSLYSRHEDVPLREPFMSDEHQKYIQQMFANGSVRAALRSEIDYTDAVTSKDAFLSVLTALAYTTCEQISDADYNVRIPNKEVRDEFKRAIRVWTETHIIENHFESTDAVVDRIEKSFRQKNVASIRENFSKLVSRISETTDAKHHCDVIFGVLATYPYCDDWHVERSFDQVIFVSQKVQFHCNIALRLKLDPNGNVTDPIAVNFMINGNSTFEQSTIEAQTATTSEQGCDFVDDIIESSKHRVAQLEKQSFKFVWYTCIIIGKKVLGIFRHMK
ncbi:uncharacterized protein LOC135840171 isoform X3 [Planococcus citri]|uniref:uncharacterized protein LOC135840171 isoform X3 n=1 Tax=Planococcus citri TaxID=170843 RepID=UPI0031F94799